MGKIPLVHNDPQHWHARANEVRLIADRVSDIASRAQMLGLAEQYEKLAVRAVQRLKVRATRAAASRPQAKAAFRFRLSASRGGNSRLAAAGYK